jgi:hypothetical protein
MDVLSLLKFIAGSGIFIAGITYLAKRFIDKSLDAAIEKYKSSLQQELELYKHNLSQETEKLKFELNKTSLEHQVRYNSLYQERGSIIKEVYSEILKIDEELLNLTTMLQGADWRKTENNFSIRELIFKFEKDFEFKRLYFKQDMCDGVESLIEKMKTINHRMYSAKLQAETNEAQEKYGNILTGEERLKPTKEWKALESEASTDMKMLRRALEREFAKLIGVEQ